VVGHCQTNEMNYCTRDQAYKIVHNGMQNLQSFLSFV
jgi:hypothetical protein